LSAELSPDNGWITADCEFIYINFAAALVFSFYFCYNHKIISYKEALKGKNTLTIHPEKGSQAERAPGS
jgi:hypothetical protein